MGYREPERVVKVREVLTRDLHRGVWLFGFPVSKIQAWMTKTPVTTMTTTVPRTPSTKTYGKSVG